MSPRPRKPRLCACAVRWGKGLVYKPAGRPLRDLSTVILRKDELEALRLCDAEGLSQEEAGGRMGVSRGTVQRLASSGRSKVAAALSEGAALVLEAPEEKERAMVPHEAGKSSFGLLDRDAFAAGLPLASARRVLDLGCGAGAYTLFLAERLRPGATIHGVDLWAEGISRLLGEARERGLGGVTAEVADLAHLASLPDGEADLVLLATVAHDLVERGAAAPALREAARLLGTGRCLAVVEFKVADTRPGPPRAIRLSPEALAAWVEPCGFGPPRIVDLGPHLYAALFPRGESPQREERIRHAV